VGSILFVLQGQTRPPHSVTDICPPRPWRSSRFSSRPKGDEVARFKADRIFNPLHVVVNKISVADIDNLNLFKLSDHPQIGPHIEGMKSEINKYHAIVQSIKSLDERKDAKGQDTFSLPSGGGATLEHFLTFLLCCERC
jgi:hypothetical protein